MTQVDISRKSILSYISKGMTVHTGSDQKHQSDLKTSVSDDYKFFRMLYEFM